MLTVIREMADAVAAAARARGSGARLGPEATDERAERAARRDARDGADAGEEAVERHARAARRARRGRRRRRRRPRPVGDHARAGRRASPGEQVELPEIPHYAAGATLDQVHHADSRYRYCTNFIVTGEGLDGRPFVARARGARRLGARRRRRRDAQGPRPHRRPRRREARCSTAPARSTREDIADMREQIAEREARLGGGAHRRRRGRRRRRAERLFEELGAIVVDGGPTLNPSTQDLLAAIERLPGDEVIVLPNSRQRDHGRRGGGEAHGKNGRTVVVVASTRSRPRSRRWSSSTRRGRGRQRRAAGRACSPRSAPAASPRRRATTPRAASCAATRSASPATRSSPGAARGSTLARGDRVLAEGAEIVTVIEGEGAPIPRRRAAPAGCPTASSSRRSSAAAPTTAWLIAAQ